MEAIKRTDTAHHEWNDRWKTEEGREAWMIPETFVVETIPFLKDRGVRQVLDLGCGVGRHSFLFASEGFETHAYDGSQAGIDFINQNKTDALHPISATVGEMTNLPYDNESMDYLLAWNVIYHGDLSIVTRSISEILRVLKPGGLFQGTMLSKRNSEFIMGMTNGERVSKDTFIKNGLSDKSHLHFYCGFLDLASLFYGFEILSIRDKVHKRPDSYHWEFLAEKI